MYREGCLKSCFLKAGDEEAKFMDALEYMLQTWLAVLLDHGSIPMDSLAKYCVPCFDAYVMCHLGPPYGKRLMVRSHVEQVIPWSLTWIFTFSNLSTFLNPTQRDEEEINDVEESDREKYKDQLGTLGVIGRSVGFLSVFSNLHQRSTFQWRFAFVVDYGNEYEQSQQVKRKSKCK
jgi:hypothetical protein